MRKFIFLLAVLLPFSASAKLLDLTVFRLDNGLEVAVVENHKAPIVLQMLYYKTGSLNDPRGKGGIAHLLEHLMFRGTTEVPDRQFNQLTDEHGASNNAYTTFDVTAYFEFSDISKLELMMALEADRMAHLKISDEAFLSERDVVLQERYQRYETQPAPLFYEMLDKLLWQNHPRANPVSGNVSEIKALKREDAEDFYHKWYRPDNALLVLAGDIKPDEAKILAEKYYGKIKNPQTKSEVLEINEDPRAVDTFVKVQLEGVTQPRYASYIRLDAGELSKKDVLALNLLAEYLAGDDTSYLYDKLVYQDKKLLSIDIGLDYDEKYGGSLAFYAVPADDTLSAEEIARLLETEAGSGITHLVPEKLQKIQNQTLADTVYLQENPQSAARFVGTMLLDGYTAEQVMNYDEAITAVTLEDVVAAWQKVQAAKVRIKGYLEGKEQ